ncbi:hypothetical protein BGP77_11605 [Saccharospirillum sp. MSK14-1]|uniref:hypothetical protein n=1 Tax=Saccharospirillum sp. MSK14-1 TaxID=1897632 RepID=UPI000D38EDB8|nr:hypothetical protein [Saccharospirillum sp. MSK14-1]PTY38584.1 hypothetical protein BGP77_11605 [Saccharospirillum sp. MSK14-1]
MGFFTDDQASEFQLPEIPKREYALNVIDDAPPVDGTINLLAINGATLAGMISGTFLKTIRPGDTTFTLFEHYTRDVPFLQLYSPKSDLTKAYICTRLDVENDVEVTIVAVDNSGTASGGSGITAKVAGTVAVEGAPAGRPILIIKDDPAGRQVIAETMSQSDGLFDITYPDWDGPVIAMSMDYYGESWARITAINAGTIVHPTIPNGYVYEATAAGVTDENEPTWSTNEAVIDGGVTWNPRPFYRPVASGPIQGEVLTRELLVYPSEAIAMVGSQQALAVGLSVGDDGTLNNSNFYVDAPIQPNDTRFIVWQVQITASDDQLIGITNKIFTEDLYLGQNNAATKDSIGNWAKGRTYFNLTSSSEDAILTMAAGDIVTVIFRAASNEIHFYVGAASKGGFLNLTPSNPALPWMPAISVRENGSSSFVFDKDLFTNLPPTIDSMFPNWEPLKKERPVE